MVGECDPQSGGWLQMSGHPRHTGFGGHWCNSSDHEPKLWIKSHSSGARALARNEDTTGFVLTTSFPRWLGFHLSTTNGLPRIQPQGLCTLSLYTPYPMHKHDVRDITKWCHNCLLPSSSGKTLHKHRRAMPACLRMYGQSRQFRIPNFDPATYISDINLQHVGHWKIQH